MVVPMSDDEQFVCWSCDGAGENERATGIVTVCQACNGDGLLSECMIRRMWREWKDDEIPERCV